jgi:hypothetical protein
MLGGHADSPVTAGWLRGQPLEPSRPAFPTGADYARLAGLATLAAGAVVAAIIAGRPTAGR